MPRAASINYRAGGFSSAAYFAVKRDGKYVYAASAPKISIQEILYAVQEIEDGDEDIHKLLGWRQNDLPQRVYEELHRDDEATLEEIGVTRKDLGMLATFAFYPESYEAIRGEDKIIKLLDNLLSIGSIVRVLDARYWNHDIVIADGELKVPVPKTRDDIHHLWMFQDVLKYGRRFPKRRR